MQVTHSGRSRLDPQQGARRDVSVRVYVSGSGDTRVDERIDRSDGESEA